ncbi:PucR family transcriptional regulator [Anaerovorax odorimutans]|uniref:PucR family transcriptional regulator n=1 Tax=Anaerovorax odorimutans TaxID=109327 RepID=A0ABT1RMK6_9FIRM|nr:PucR family transcriptional regulator [Anaerovorax odorimutans]MCQ4636426.1 PucR family transcriptional regulator [Anaerovorax odorimutans]
MITVKRILKDELFEDFKLVAGEKGLNNIVTGNAIFDWETPEEIKKTFKKGDFVITTLRKAKEDKKLTEECVKTLFYMRVSAIAVRSIYYDEIPENIRTNADAFGVPIFLFKKGYTEDIIYFIRKKIAEDANKRFAARLARELLGDVQNKELVHDFIEQNGMRIYKNLICIYCCGLIVGNKELYEDWRMEEDIVRIVSEKESDNADYSTIKAGNGILITYSYAEGEVDKKGTSAAISDLLKQLEELKAFHIGVSRNYTNRNAISEAMKESIFANISSRIDNETIRSFDAIGADKLLIPIQNNPCVVKSYEEKIDLITQYDSRHNSFMFKTLLTFVESNGSIKLTSQKMFQHENTIRYRIDRIKKMFAMEDSESYYIEMYIIVRLYKIKKCIREMLIENDDI